MSLINQKLKEVLSSVLPIVILVSLTGLTIVPFGWLSLGRFWLGSLCIIFGLTLFLVGVEWSVSPMGEKIGEQIIRRNSLILVILAGLFLGFLISMAEPDLHILASQVNLVSNGVIGKWFLVQVVSAGIGALIAIGLVRIVYGIPLYLVLTGLYLVVLILGSLATPEFLAIAFDASGATTGAMTVPFILALGLSIARKKSSGKAAEKDSFGLVGVASVGAILSVLAVSLTVPRNEFAPAIVFPEPAGGFFQPFVNQFQIQAPEAALAIAPLAAILMLLQPGVLRLKRPTLFRMVRGFFLDWLGLILIFAGVNAGFMDVGRTIGAYLARHNLPLLLAMGFGLGFLTNLAEPAVHILTRQIEDVTSGSVPKLAVQAFLAIGVGLAVVLSILRILIPPLQLWHILLPGYILAIFLAHRGSKLFVGIAFDSGGVASGPMTATFILAFAQGAANEFHSANVLIDGFGVIALVALAPLLSLQLLGLFYRRKALEKGGISRD
ncbi:MAG: DUF1538 domain-containing protein [Clostridia bacterium]|nr:DUF1538 domain-containing protein [Clostridia bacterium]NCC75256.1 DUF1538 domain-containing protein [Clostridia bacterium]